MDCARAIRIARAVRGYSQAELALRAGYSPSHISLLEDGKRTPSVHTLSNIAAATGARLDILTALATGQTPDGRGVLMFLLGA